MKISAKNTVSMVALATLAFGLAGFAHAQKAPKSSSTPAPAQTAATPAPPAADSSPAAAPQSGWAARCGSASRNAPLECAVEETAVFSKTGQVAVMVNIRVPSDTRVPVILAQLPLGISLPGGAAFQVDDGKTTDLQIQTCENRGCFASTQITPDVLTALRSGKQLKVSFQNLAKETIAIPMPLTDFAAAYDKIK